MRVLDIDFAGICTHFLQSGMKNLPVPHRVVLPYVGTFRFGIVDTTVTGFSNQPYFLQPHFPFLQFGDPDVEAPTIEGLMTGGHFYGTGCSINVFNPTSPLEYDPSFKDVPHLGSYADYTPSDEVVTGGRAACYFDITGGTLSMQPNSKGAMMVHLHVETELDPVLQITRFGAKDTFDLPMPGSNVSLTLYNAEVGPLGSATDEDTPYDFMLHYETATRALPLQLTQPAPGMNSDTLGNALWTKERVRKALNDLADVASGVDVTGGPDVAAMASMSFTSLSPSCSNSQYP